MKSRLTHTILREELAKKKITSYSVTQFCKAIGMGRANFYNTYKNLSDLFCNTLQFELHKHFRNYRDLNARQLVYALIKEIGNERIYYSNIYYLTNKGTYKKHICHQINHTFFTEMQNHLQNSNYSITRIKSITNIIFSRLISWVSHSCDDNVLDVYKDLEVVLP